MGGVIVLNWIVAMMVLFSSILFFDGYFKRQTTGLPMEGLRPVLLLAFVAISLKTALFGESVVVVVVVVVCFAVFGMYYCRLA